MATQQPTLSDVLEAAINAFLADVHTVLVGRVESYDPATQTISARAVVRRGFATEDGERATEELPVLNNVPVGFPGGTRGWITWPVAVGDTVLLLIGELSHDRWLQIGGAGVDPGDDRRFNLSDAFAIPAFRDFAHPISPVETDAMVVHTEDELRLGDADTTDPALNTIDGSDFMAALANAIATSGDTGPGSLTALQAALTTLGVPTPGDVEPTHIGKVWPVGAKKARV